jgi:hypothetical protein
MRRVARLAAVLLLAVWVGPVSLVQTDSWTLLRWAGAPGPAAATAQLLDAGPESVPAGQALLLQPGTPLRLHMRDHTTVKGRYLGRTLLDSTSYAARYETYAGSATWVPLALGETLRVVMRDGRLRTAAFAGYGELSLLLVSPDSGRVLRVPFEFSREIFRADGTSLLPRVLAREFREHRLPSAEALVVGDRVPGGGSEADQGAVSLSVPVDEIETVMVNLPGQPHMSGWVALGIVASVVLIVALVIRNQPPPPQPSCDPGPFYGGFAGAHLTARPFDLVRGCFVGDPIAVADPWPVAAEAPVVAALTDSASTQAATR